MKKTATMISQYFLLCFLCITSSALVSAVVPDDKAVKSIEDSFYLSPDEVVKKFRDAGYTIVPAPDANPGHPQLFYAGSPFTITVLREEDTIKVIHPTISVVVNQIGMSFSYLSMGSPKKKLTLSEKLAFCNNWNYRVRMAACFVDTEGRYNLHQETTFVHDLHVNMLLVDEHTKQFERSLGLFAKKLVEEPYSEGATKQ
eukprot:PhF_6_TR4651/c0_g3_i1/m.6500